MTSVDAPGTPSPGAASGPPDGLPSAPGADPLVEALAQLSFVVQLALTEAAAAQDLSLTQLRLLGILRDRDPAMAELARRLGLDRSSVSGLVDRAQKRGLVRREPRPEDGRGVRVSLTGDGAALLARVQAPVAARLHALTGKLSDRERAQLLALVGRILPDG